MLRMRVALPPLSHPRKPRRCSKFSRTFPVSHGAVAVGKVEESPRGLVVLQSRIGGNRVVDMLSGEQLREFVRRHQG